MGDELATQASLREQSDGVKLRVVRQVKRHACCMVELEVEVAIGATSLHPEPDRLLGGRQVDPSLDHEDQGGCEQDGVSEEGMAGLNPDVQAVFPADLMVEERKADLVEHLGRNDRPGLQLEQALLRMAHQTVHEHLHGQPLGEIQDPAGRLSAGRGVRTQGTPPGHLRSLIQADREIRHGCQEFPGQGLFRTELDEPPHMICVRSRTGGDRAGGLQWLVHKGLSNDYLELLIPLLLPGYGHLIRVPDQSFQKRQGCWFWTRGRAGRSGVGGLRWGRRPWGISLWTAWRTSSA